LVRKRAMGSDYLRAEFNRKLNLIAARPVRDERTT